MSNATGRWMLQTLGNDAQYCGSMTSDATAAHANSKTLLEFLLMRVADEDRTADR